MRADIIGMSVEVHEVDGAVVVEVAEWLTPPRLGLEMRVTRERGEIVACWMIEDGRRLVAPRVGFA